uniref:TFIIB domain-containing protein n=1 Tax=Panagrellus redivivus TaxID=6233 RepID=A0A7E4V4N4_PANRE
MDPAHATFQIFLTQLNDEQPVREMATYFFDLVLQNEPSYQAYDALSVACIWRSRLRNGLISPLPALATSTLISVNKIREGLAALQRAQSLELANRCKPEYMEKFCAPLNLSPAVQAAATQIYAKALELNFVDKTDDRYVEAFCAAAVFKASQCSDSPKTAQEIAEAVSVLEGDILHANELLLLLASYS